MLYTCTYMCVCVHCILTYGNVSHVHYYMLHHFQDDDLDENFVTARNTMVHTAGGTMVSASGAADDTITDLGTLVIVGEPDDAEEMDTMKSECVCGGGGVHLYMYVCRWHHQWPLSRCAYTCVCTCVHVCAHDIVYFVYMCVYSKIVNISISVW